MTTGAKKTDRNSQSPATSIEKWDGRIQEHEGLPGNEPVRQCLETGEIRSGLLKFYTRKVLSKIQPRKVLEQKLHRPRKDRRET